MPHIHNAPGQHDLTASIFIVRTDQPRPAIMLHMHRKLGKLLQFGGHIELNETPWQGVLRELREESGYMPDQLTLLQPPGAFTEQFAGAAGHPLPCYFNTHRFAGDEHFHSDLVYAAIATQPPRHHPGPAESGDIRLLRAEDLHTLSSDIIFEQTRHNALFVLTSLMRDWESVPTTRWPL